ncbi:hypothetical protein NHQ30_002350 [Ciborinia camelliae]|nr:hypothetical protein NHQ30_002350 [Ciborinia camelliae]
MFSILITKRQIESLAFLKGHDRKWLNLKMITLYRCICMRYLDQEKNVSEAWIVWKHLQNMYRALDGAFEDIAIFILAEPSPVIENTTVTNYVGPGNGFSRIRGVLKHAEDGYTHMEATLNAAKRYVNSLENLALNPNLEPEPRRDPLGDWQRAEPVFPTTTISTPRYSIDITNMPAVYGNFVGRGGISVKESGKILRVYLRLITNFEGQGRDYIGIEPQCPNLSDANDEKRFLDAVEIIQEWILTLWERRMSNNLIQYLDRIGSHTSSENNTDAANDGDWLSNDFSDEIDGSENVSNKKEIRRGWGGDSGKCSPEDEGSSSTTTIS